MRNDKRQRLIQVAKLYYEEDRTQNEISKILGVSRPMVSRMLTEAKNSGIVKITIAEEEIAPAERIEARYKIKKCICVEVQRDDSTMNQALAQSILELIYSSEGSKVGIGWGYLIGKLTETAEKLEQVNSNVQIVCPMLGNSNVAIRYYHSNENVRIIAEHLMANPIYLHTSAIAESAYELDLVKQTSNFKVVEKIWNSLNIAIVNIGDYPSSPDFASGARFGGLLQKKKAVGRILAYYFDENGEIINSETDYAVQIPIESLEKCDMVVGVCSASVGLPAIHGALRTGLLTHIIMRSDKAEQICAI